VQKSGSAKKEAEKENMKASFFNAFGLQAIVFRYWVHGIFLDQFQMLLKF
jgi:hypothetical protein